MGIPGKAVSYLETLHDYLEALRKPLELPLGDPRRPLSATVVVTYVDHFSAFVSATINSTIENKKPGYIASLLTVRDLLGACERLNKEHDMGLVGIEEIKQRILHLFETAAGTKQPKVTIGADGRRVVTDLVEDGGVATSSVGSKHVH